MLDLHRLSSSVSMLCQLLYCKVCGKLKPLKPLKALIACDTDTVYQCAKTIDLNYHLLTIMSCANCLSLLACRKCNTFLPTDCVSRLAYRVAARRVKMREKPTPGSNHKPLPCSSIHRPANLRILDMAYLSHITLPYMR